jgi:hemerythrin
VLTVKWIEAYATGVARIDHQHQTIFKTAEDFRAALDDGEGQKTYPVLLNFLVLYCRGHFGFEERCMDHYRCPAAKKNAKAHTGFMEVLRDFKERYEVKGYVAADARAMVDAVDRWLDGHICRIDVQLKDSVAASPAEPDITN